MKLFLVSLYVFITFFSPKFGILDFRLLLLPVGFIFCFRNLKIPLFILQTIIVVLSIISYYFVLSYFYNSPQDELLRYFRILVSIFVILFLFSFPNVSIQVIQNSIVVCLVINLFIMILNLIFPSFHLFVQSIYFDEGKILEKTNRVIGLSSGFDTSGVILLISILFFFFLALKHQSYFYFLILCISSFLAFFVSRGTIVYFLILFIFFSIKFMFSNKFLFRHKFLVYLVLFVIILFAIPHVSKIFLGSVDIEFLGIEAEVNPEIIENQYAKTDVLGMAQSFIVLPNTLSGLIFGLTQDIEVDSGYIKTIYQIGLVGIFLTLFSHFKIYSSIKNKPDGSFLNFKLFLFLILLLLTISNFKNSMFFVRGVFEIYLSLSLFFYKFHEK